MLSDETADVVTFLKSVTMKVVVEKISAAWDQITPVTIRHSWQKLISLPQESDIPPETNEHTVTTFVHDIQLIGCNMSENEVEEWLASDKDDPGYAHFSDNEIADHVLNSNLSLQDDEDESEDECDVLEATCPVSHSTAMDMLGKCLEWLEHQPKLLPIT